MTIVTVGIDLAKNVFAAPGVGEAGNPYLVCPEVPRAKLLQLIAHLAPCRRLCARMDKPTANTATA